jgi:DNA-binding MarR family transcriptional regulator
MPFQAPVQMALHIRPLGAGDAVDVGVAYRAVPAGLVMADHPILLRSERLDRLLRPKIEIVSTQAYYFAAKPVKCVLEKHELAGGIHVAHLPTLAIPGVANLDPIDLGDDVVIPCATDDGAGLEVTHDPGKHVAVLEAAQSRGNIILRLVGRRHHGKPQLPEGAICRRCLKCRDVLRAHRLEPNGSPFEDNGNGLNHPRLLILHKSAIISVLIRYQGADKMVKDVREGLTRLPIVGEAKRGPEGYLTYLLRQANASVRLALDRALAKEDMTYPQQSALTMIRAYEAISAADLARLTMLTPQTVNGIVRALEVRGAIRKEPDRVNGRILRLIITDEGRELNRRCRALAAPIEAALKAKISRSAEGVIRQWLVDIAKALLE